MASSTTDKATKQASASPFRDAVFDQIEDRKNMRVGENGCLEYTDAGIGSEILALSQLVRGGDVSLAKDILERGNTNEIVQLVILNFVIRNTRGGKGEKKLAYDLFLLLLRYYPDTGKELLPMFVHYGYWKDIFLLMELALDHPNYKDLKEASFEMIQHQWHKDLAALSDYKNKMKAASVAGDEELVAKLKKSGPSISLLAKWLPREGKALDKKIDFVENFSKLVYPDAPVLTADGGEDSWKSGAKGKYRKQLAQLTSFLALPEVLLAAHRADEIEISRVASKATKLLTKAFLNENKEGATAKDPKRIRLREMFLDAIVEKGLKGGQVAPHEIVSTIMKNRNNISDGMKLALDAQWKSLWAGVVKDVKAKAAEEGLEFDPTKMVPISDVSGSMTGTPMEVSIALGIGISEITHDAFRDMVMTFSHDPEWFRFEKDDNIVDKVIKLERAPWGMNTDFEKAYNLVLQVCEENKLGKEDMPCLIVFSDMQFDHARTDSRSTMFDHIRARVKEVGEKLGWEDCEPSPIVFWNLRNTGGHPVGKDTEGTVLLSGFSPSLLKLVMNGEALKEEEVEVVEKDGTVVTKKIRVTPEQVLLKMLDDSLYDPVRVILGTSREGALTDYEHIPTVTKGEMNQKGDDDFEMV
eukprot:scaffold1525_cov142-Cylindrotheca_fusiformis.AAC.5